MADEVGKSVALDDERVVEQIFSGAKPYVLLIFAQQDGRRFLDERYVIVSVYSAGMG